MSVNLDYAAALALVGLLSSCASVHRGPSTEDLRISNRDYEDCLLTSDYPTECANEQHLWRTLADTLEFGFED
jgi:hypothetical protein